MDALARRCDTLIIGGAMAYTFLKAKGVDVGGSRIDNGKLTPRSESWSAASREV